MKSLRNFPAPDRIECSAVISGDRSRGATHTAGLAETAEIHTQRYEVT